MSDEGDTPPDGSAEPGLLGDIGHTALDLLGLVPVLGEPADLANAAWHAAEGNYLDAGLSMISVIPVVGDIIGKGGKLAKRLGGKLSAKALDTVKSLDFAEILGKFSQHPTLGPHVEKITHALEGWRDKLLKNFSDCNAPGLPGGCPLLAARQKTAGELLQAAANAEKQVTPELAQLAREQGATLEGLAFRLKSEESLARKLADTAADDIADALRYTMVSKPGDFAANARRTLESLQAQGYEVLKVKNSFVPGAPYKGLNTQLKSPGGQVFELQFHTPQSFDTKQNLTHALYEEFRVMADTDPRKAGLLSKLVDISSAVATPPGLSDALRAFLK